MNKIYFVLMIMSTLIYSDVNNKKSNVNAILGIYKVTKHNCLKNLNGDSICQDVSLYEFKNNVDKNKSNEMLLIGWKRDYVDTFKLYYNATSFEIDDKSRMIYPFTLVLSDGKKDNYIETIYFLDKNHGIKKAGFKKGLIEEVYFERIYENEIKKYKRLFPLANKPVNKKGHISESYFERISKSALSENKKIFKYESKDLSAKELRKLYELKDANDSIFLK